MVERDKYEANDTTPFDESKLQDLQTIKHTLLHALYGKDVRPGIAQLPDALIKAIQDADSLGQLGAIMEVIEARSGFETLGIHEQAQDNSININKSDLNVVKGDIDTTKLGVQKAQTGVDNVNNRLNQLTTPPTVDQNKEIADARVGAPSTGSRTYSNLGTAIRSQIDYVNSRATDNSKNINGVVNLDSTISRAFVADSDVWVSYKNGGLVSFTSGQYASVYKAELPVGATKLSCNELANIPVPSEAGCAFYDVNGAFISGSKETTVIIPDKAYFFSVTKYKQSEITDFSVTVQFEINNSLMQQFAAIKNMLAGSSTKTLTMTKNSWISVKDGSVNEYTSNQYASIQFEPVLEGCVKIITPDVTLNTAGDAGYAFYDKNKKIIRGGKSTILTVPEQARYWSQTSYNKDTFSDYRMKVEYTFDSGLKQLIGKSSNSMANKKIGISGDSITFGYDPIADDGTQLATPWPKKVGDLLGCPVDNLGVSSASLLYKPTAMWTPPMALIKEYPNYSDNYDIFGFMIGINDFFRGYDIGTMDDRNSDTFYGGLHTVVQALVKKYPPKSHDLFIMLYPTYVGAGKYPELKWDAYAQAIKDVAEYYSVSVLDLSKEMGVNIYSDTDCQYWIGNIDNPAGRNPHPTQLGADVIARTVANFIQRKFLK